MKADRDLINWIMNESGLSKYSISKATGISKATLSDLTTGKASIGNMTLRHAATLTEYAETKLREDTRMNIRIKETGAIKPLQATTRNGVVWTEDLLGNNDALNHNRETGEYEMETEDDYEWWKEYIENWESDDAELVALAEKLDIDPLEIDEKISDVLDGNDLTSHHDTIQKVLQEIKEDAPAYVIETEDPEKVKRGDHAIVEIFRTYSKKEAQNLFYSMNYDEGLTVMLSKIEGNETELIEEIRA